MLARSRTRDALTKASTDTALRRKGALITDFVNVDLENRLREHTPEKLPTHGTSSKAKSPLQCAEMVFGDLTNLTMSSADCPSPHSSSKQSECKAADPRLHQSKQVTTFSIAKLEHSKQPSLVLAQHPSKAQELSVSQISHANHRRAKTVAENQPLDQKSKGAYCGARSSVDDPSGSVAAQLQQTNMILEAEKSNLLAELAFYKRELAKLCLKSNAKFPIFRPQTQLTEDESLYVRSSKYTVLSGFDSQNAKVRGDQQGPNPYQLHAHMLYGQGRGATQFQTLASNDEDRTVYRFSGLEDQVSTTISQLQRSKQTVQRPSENVNCFQFNDRVAANIDEQSSQFATNLISEPESQEATSQLETTGQQISDPNFRPKLETQSNVPLKASITQKVVPVTTLNLAKAPTPPSGEDSYALANQQSSVSLKHSIKRRKRSERCSSRHSANHRSSSSEVPHEAQQEKPHHPERLPLPSKSRPTAATNKPDRQRGASIEAYFDAPSAADHTAPSQQPGDLQNGSKLSEQSSSQHLIVTRASNVPNFNECMQASSYADEQESQSEQLTQRDPPLPQGTQQSCHPDEVFQSPDARANLTASEGRQRGEIDSFESPIDDSQLESSRDAQTKFQQELQRLRNQLESYNKAELQVLQDLEMSKSACKSFGETSSSCFQNATGCAQRESIELPCDTLPLVNHTLPSDNTAERDASQSIVTDSMIDIRLSGEDGQPLVVDEQLHVTPRQPCENEIKIVDCAVQDSAQSCEGMKQEAVGECQNAYFTAVDANAHIWFSRIIEEEHESESAADGSALHSRNTSSASCQLKPRATAEQQSTVNVKQMNKAFRSQESNSKDLRQMQETVMSRETERFTSKLMSPAYSSCQRQEQSPCKMGPDQEQSIHTVGTEKLKELILMTGTSDSMSLFSHIERNLAQIKASEDQNKHLKNLVQQQSPSSESDLENDQPSLKNSQRLNDIQGTASREERDDRDASRLSTNAKDKMTQLSETIQFNAEAAQTGTSFPFTSQRSQPSAEPQPPSHQNEQQNLEAVQDDQMVVVLQTQRKSRNGTPKDIKTLIDLSQPATLLVTNRSNKFSNDPVYQTKSCSATNSFDKLSKASPYFQEHSTFELTKQWGDMGLQNLNRTASSNSQREMSFMDKANYMVFSNPVEKDIKVNLVDMSPDHARQDSGQDYGSKDTAGELDLLNICNQQVTFYVTSGSSAACKEKKHSFNFNSEQDMRQGLMSNAKITPVLDRNSTAAASHGYSTWLSQTTTEAHPTDKDQMREQTCSAKDARGTLERAKSTILFQTLKQESGYRSPSFVELAPASRTRTSSTAGNQYHLQADCTEGHSETASAHSGTICVPALPIDHHHHHQVSSQLLHGAKQQRTNSLANLMVPVRKSSASVTEPDAKIERRSSYNIYKRNSSKITRADESSQGARAGKGRVDQRHQTSLKSDFVDTREEDVATPQTELKKSVLRGHQSQPSLEVMMVCPEGESRSGSRPLDRSRYKRSNHSSSVTEICSARTVESGRDKAQRKSCEGDYEDYLNGKHNLNSTRHEATASQDLARSIAQESPCRATDLHTLKKKSISQSIIHGSLNLYKRNLEQQSASSRQSRVHPMTSASAASLCESRPTAIFTAKRHSLPYAGAKNQSSGATVSALRGNQASITVDRSKQGGGERLAEAGEQRRGTPSYMLPIQSKFKRQTLAMVRAQEPKIMTSSALQALPRARSSRLLF